MTKKYLRVRSELKTSEIETSTGSQPEQRQERLQLEKSNGISVPAAEEGNSTVATSSTAWMSKA